MADSILSARNRGTLLAGMLSLILPGLGHIYQGRRKLGFVLTILSVSLLVVTNIFGVSHFFAGYLAAIWATAIFSSLAIIHCVYYKDRQEKAANPTWLVASFGILAIGSSLYLYQLCSLASGTRMFVVPSSSMEPTVVVGEVIAVDLHYYKTHDPRRGELVVLRAKDVPHSLRRIIAIGGDSIEIRNALVYVNGTKIDEPFLKYRIRTDVRGADWINNYGPMRVPDRFLFAMGDNRPVSYDSRAPEVGPIPVENLEGRPLYIARSRDNARLGTTLN